MVHIGTDVHPKKTNGTHRFSEMAHIGTDVLQFSLYSVISYRKMVNHGVEPKLHGCITNLVTSGAPCMWCERLGEWMVCLVVSATSL
jgi:hypothetical protein